MAHLRRPDNSRPETARFDQNEGSSMFKLLIAPALAMFTALAPASAAFDPDRIVTAVDETAKTFSCHPKASETSYTYKTTSKTVIRTAGKRVRLYYLWDSGHFSEIKVGMVITVKYHLVGGDRVAERVTINPK
ncbi:MAG TPA: hypothetical protein VMI47_09820 [Pseudolabrys sp.]|nr:hypothetical protein [Pseudolabrys sp.]